MIYLCQADGKLPNLALAKLAAHYRAGGQAVRLLHSAEDHAPLLGPRPAAAFGSSIFTTSVAKRRSFDAVIGGVTWGGTGVRLGSSLAEVDPSVDWDRQRPDFADWPAFSASMGFLTRGCRLRCGFCQVPRNEGSPRLAASVYDVWRGDPWPRHLHLLDNDAFAPALRDHWRTAVAEIRAGGFKVCFTQGLNIRMIDEESADAVASLDYTGHDFDKARLFTAWDNLGDERIFRRGVEILARAGVPATHLCVYMLVGYDKRETWEAVLYRFLELRALGCDVYPMPYEKWKRPDLAHFQRWVRGHVHKVSPFPDYRPLPPALRATITAAWDKVASGWKPMPRGALPLSSE